MRNKRKEKSSTFENLEFLFTFCERLGVAVATSLGGAAMLYFGKSGFLPLPVIGMWLGVFVLVGGICLGFFAAGMFFTEICESDASRIKTYMLAVLITTLPAYYMLAAVKAGIVALGH